MILNACTYDYVQRKRPKAENHILLKKNAC